MLDNENHYQLNSIIRFLQRLGANVTTQFEELCKNLDRAKRLKKRDESVCEWQLARGECLIRRCHNRHVLVPEDATTPRDIIAGSQIWFVLTAVVDASCIAGRISHVSTSDGSMQELPNDYFTIIGELREHYTNKDNWECLAAPQLQSLCAIQDSKGVFHRGRISRIIAKDKLGQATVVNVRRLESGDLIEVQCSELFHLPEHLCSYPPQAVVMYIAGLAPCDFDTNWSPMARNLIIQRAYKRRLQADEYWRVNIIVALREAFIVGRPLLMKKLPSLGTEVIEVDIGKMLVEEGLAVHDNRHLPRLLALCDEAGIERPIQLVNKKELCEEKGTWAFLSTELTQVIFYEAYSSDTIFLAQTKFYDLLLALEKDCSIEAEKWKTRKENTEDWTPVKGSYCMFFDSVTENWRRGTIEELESESESAVIQAVDYGGVVSYPILELVPLPENLISRLPFQAVECSIGGVEHITPCPEEVLDKLYAFSKDGVEPCYVIAEVSIDNSKYTGGHHYVVNLANQQGQSFGKSLVDSGLLNKKLEEGRFLQDISCLPCKEEEDNNSDSCNSSVVNEKEDDEYMRELNDLITNEKDETCLTFMRVLQEEFRCDPLGTKVPALPAPEVKETALTYKNASLKPGYNNKNVEATDQNEENEMNRVDESFVLVVRSKEGDILLTPKILWQQDSLRILVRVTVLDVKDYYVYVEAKRFFIKCRTDKDKKNYAANIMLWGGVSCAHATVKVTPFHIELSVPKLYGDPWPRLQLDSEIYRRNIQYDPDPFLKSNHELNPYVRRNAYAIPCESDSESVSGSEMELSSVSSSDSIAFAAP